MSRAYSIDKKVDDGMPQSGNVLAQYVVWSTLRWASGGPLVNDSGVMVEQNTGDEDRITGGLITSATFSPYYDDQNGATASQMCYGNGDTLAPEQYSVGVNNGSNVNCALSFRFQ